MRRPRVARQTYDRANAWREARQLLSEHRRPMLVGALLTVGNRVCTLVPAYVSKLLIDDVIGWRRPDLLLPLAGVSAVAMLVLAATSLLQSQVVGVAALRIVTDLRRRIEGHVLRLPVAYFSSAHTGNLVARIMGDTERVRSLVGTALLQLMASAITAIMALGILFYEDWRLTSILLVVLSTYGVVSVVAFGRLRPIHRRRGAAQAEVAGRLTETLSGIRVVKVYGAERREQAVFARGVHRVLRLAVQSTTATSLVGAATMLIGGIVTVLLMIVGGRAVLAGTMTLGDMASYVFLVGLLSAPLSQLAGLSAQVSEAFAGLDRLRELREVSVEDAADHERFPVHDVAGRVEFQDVRFAYLPGVEVIRGVSLVAEPGTTTALVGASGAGKSTLMSLVMAFHYADAGRVLVDGRDLRDLRPRDYRRHLGVVMQENFLFDGTVRDNIAFGNPGAADARIREAARIAHCEEFIDRLPRGYDTVVGERGARLSGGQRQRVAIARAIVADPSILLLDEATSSLDSESEALIRDGLQSLRRGRTTFVIAHRLSTVESADQILVIDDGRVVEHGRHAELLALEGLYARLHRRQQGAERDQLGIGRRAADEIPV